MAKDHYVPQFYLRNFEITKISSRIQPKHIYSYKKGLSPKALPIQSVACESDFDKFAETEVDAETYNKLLKVSEDVAPTLISEIISDSGFSISESGKEALSWFIALLTIRTPSAHQFLLKDILNFHDKILLPYIQQVCGSNKDEIYRILRIEYPNISDKEVEETISFLLKKEFNWEFPNNDNNRAYIRGFGVANLDFVVNDLLSKHWHLLEIEDDSFFITSDNPVSFLSPRIQLIDNIPFCDCPVFLPLSSKKALYVHHYKFSGESILLRKNQVDFFVKETVKHANNSLFSSVKSNIIKNLFDSTYFDLTNLNYKYIFLPYFQLKSLHKLAYEHISQTRND